MSIYEEIEKDADKPTPADVGMTIAFIALSPALIVWRGYALAVLWGWFVAPIFGLQALTILQAVGLGMVAAFLRGYSDDNSEKPMRDRVRKWIIGAGVYPAAAIGFGWLVTLFM